MGSIRPCLEFCFVTFAATLGTLVIAEDRERIVIFKGQTPRRQEERQGDDASQNKTGDSQSQPMALASHVESLNLGHMRFIT